MDLSHAPNVSPEFWGGGFQIHDLGENADDPAINDLDLDDLGDLEEPPDEGEREHREEIRDDPRAWDSGVKEETVLSDTLAKRDERIDEYDRHADHETVREHVREVGLVEDLQERLDELAYEEHEVTSPEGGVLDMRNTIRRLAGDTTVDDYHREWRWRPHDKIGVCVSLDMSGSMSGDELKAKSAVGAFLHVVQQAGGRVVANAWHTEPGGAKVEIVTGPKEPFRWAHLDTTRPRGYTPTGLGVWEAGLLLERVGMRDRLLIVVTDGQPTRRARDGDYENSVDEAVKTVEQLRNRGLTVVGFGFGRVNVTGLEEIFGADAGRYVTLDELPAALIEAYKEQCQRLAGEVVA